MIGRLIAAVALVVAVGGKPAAARAEDAVGIAVSGDPSIRVEVSSLIATWLGQHGRRAAPDAVPAATVGTVGDCFVIQDDACARRAIEQHASSSTVVYVGTELSSDPAGRVITLHLHWIAKDQQTVMESTTCTACTSDQLRTHVARLMAAVVPAATSQPTGVTSSPSTEPDGPAGDGIAFGVELGEPTAATAGWFAGKLGLTAAIGTGTRAGLGPALHAEARYEVTRLSGQFPLRVGAGGRYYHHGYQPFSIDELPDSHYGVRAVIEISMIRGPLQLYAELAPGVDLKRTRSCTLASGVDTVCPHAQSTPLFINLAIGARWFAIR